MQFHPVVILLGSPLLVCVAFLVFLPYFTKPEEFYIKRFRPGAAHQFTQAQLLFRAFVGIGFLYTGTFAAAFTLVFSIGERGVWVWFWPIMTFGAGPVLGAVYYIYFRNWRYRKSDEGGFEVKPPDRFHALQPWRIPDPATRRTLWLLAGFDALLHSSFYIAIVLTLAFIADLGALYVGLMFPSLLVITLLRRYRHMRRQYEPVPDRDDERGRRSSLSYVGPSPLSRREKTTTAIGATAVFIVGFIVAPLLVVLWHSRG